MFIVIVLGVLLIIGVAYIIHVYKKGKALKHLDRSSIQVFSLKNSMTYKEAEDAEAETWKATPKENKDCLQEMEEEAW